MPYHIDVLCIDISLKDLSDISQVIIASANIIMAFYVLIYQRRHDKRTEHLTADLNQQNIKLQWFKELVIQRNVEIMFSFYTKLNSLKEDIINIDLSEDKIIELNRFINDEASILRTSFYDVILFINKGLYDHIENNIDNLVTKLTEAISNDDYDLKDDNVYNKVITTPINYSKNTLIALIYNFQGM